MSAICEDPGYIGCRVPTEQEIEQQDRDRDKAAKMGSRALLAALNRHFERGGRG